MVAFVCEIGLDMTNLFNHADTAGIGFGRKPYSDFIYLPFIPHQYYPSRKLLYFTAYLDGNFQPGVRFDVLICLKTQPDIPSSNQSALTGFLFLPEGVPFDGETRRVVDKSMHITVCPGGIIFGVWMHSRFNGRSG